MRPFVYFDVGGTLIRPEPSVGAVYARAAAQHGLTATAEAIEAAFRSSWTAHVEARGDGTPALGVDDESTKHWWRRLVFVVLEQVGFAGDREAVFTACYEAFASADAWKIFDDVRPALDALRAEGIGLGVLSNWDHRLEPLLATLGLRAYFDPILVSAQVGLEKPDLAVFELACAQVDRRPPTVIYVGDQRRLDVVPARAVGLRAFHIDRTGQSEDSIASLAALLERV